METQKRVVIALDYNPTATKIAEAGYAFAKAMNAKITLVHIFENATYYTSFITSPITGIGDFDNATFFQYVNNSTLAEASLYYLDKIKKHLNDDAIETLVESGALTDGILEVAKNLNADLIVLGSHSQKWLEKLVIGSTTESVLNQTTLPLLIIPVKNQE